MITPKPGASHPESQRSASHPGSAGNQASDVRRSSHLFLSPTDKTASVPRRWRRASVNSVPHGVGFRGPGEEIRLEAITIVCDYGDGRVAAQQVTISYGARRLVVDLCAQHLRELTKNARAPRPGRRRKVAGAPVAKRRGRSPGSKNKAAASNRRRKPNRRKTEAKRAPARRKRAAAKSQA